MKVMDKKSAAYARHKDQAACRQLEQSRAARDIGDIPPVKNHERKRRALTDFQFFCKSYSPKRFSMEWCDDHIRIAGKIERAVIRGTMLSFAMPRGSGKTTFSEAAVIWAALTGRHPFVMLIGSSESHATQMLANIKAELSINGLLLEDFPEVIFPIRDIENISRRCQGQLHHGKPTSIIWATDKLIFPNIPGSRAAGVLIRVAGLTGNIRGAIHTRHDGSTVRPTFVVLDDPQTDESAKSPTQNDTREGIIKGAILGLAGPGKKISAVMPCTVIQQDDLSDRLLDREKHPEWQGERAKMVYKWPKDEKLWNEYRKIRTDELKNDGDGGQATAFYKLNRAKIDEGAVVAWEARHAPDELSALQHAMNLLQDRGEWAFFAEYQNEPLPDEELGDEELTADLVMSRTNGYQRRSVPVDASTITGFIDVQQKLLYWGIVAWTDEFSGYVIDYGTYPDQNRQSFSLRDAKITMAMKHPGAGVEGAIYGAFEILVDDLMGRAWVRDDGAEMSLSRILIDANWGTSTDTVYQFCRETQHKSNVTPSHGKYVGASSLPFSDYKRKVGEKVGNHWRMPAIKGKRATRYVLFDTNYWKTFIASRFITAKGDPGSLTLFGRKGTAHRMLADQVTAEYRVKTEGRGRVVDEWKLRASGQDNHFLDVLVGAGVAASMEGMALFGTEPVAKKRQRKKIRLSDLKNRG